MANVNTASASTLEKCKALLQEVVTELNSSASNSEGIAPRPVGAGSESTHNEHRRLFGFCIVVVAVDGTTLSAEEGHGH